MQELAQIKQLLEENPESPLANLLEGAFSDFDGWLCSRDRIQISQESKIFAPANMRAAQDLQDVVFSGK